ncbi:hypothetical protein [Planomonospora parontospora]|uniref:hypothetical protein n=1 Tax=Planomonospora parontospora TaxID=58119 RepID=UPI0016702314|nr:hypothetical protein [Planomonospora parontospora]GGL19076.1 hypothetical protein GCM10014719_21460 [Planomonospora parontospora subsp. antibiotica]GII15478.1 hypothetical protein Ppa05_22040 [Planomonospora parontospora subsp. antibiotica]
MRSPIQTLGVLLVLQGVSGTIDQVAVQPFMSPFLNFFNRVVVERVDFFAGYEIYANLILAVLGVVVVVAADRIRPS